MQINKSLCKKIIIDLSREYNIRVHFVKTGTDYGSARYWNRSISININQTRSAMISTFFHELGHIYCWEKKIWKSFHVNKPLQYLTKSQKLKYLRTALKAEKWIDRWAEKEMKKHFTKIKYINSYDNINRNEFTKWIKNQLG